MRCVCDKQLTACVPKICHFGNPPEEDYTHNNWKDRVFDKQEKEMEFTLKELTLLAQLYAYQIAQLETTDGDEICRMADRIKEIVKFAESKYRKVK